ncbi:hypothetical protein OHB56_22870 [Streptomyces sp. NBC_01635]|uniref:hypothetical protein n=1 Tax=Streptomyces sp. NBC_01635 TaxID=2975904 RepID=UPI003862E8B6|nr:hypothetical protein OHB56_22870 [Streptomyces sp. NBC_01635]
MPALLRGSAARRLGGSAARRPAARRLGGRRLGGRRLGGLNSCTSRLVSGGTGTAGPLPGVDRAVWNDSVEA